MAHARRDFTAHYGAAPDVVAIAPGRVNLIGEHADYNDGFVLPMAIERATLVAARRREDGILRACATVLGREVSVPLAIGYRRQPGEGWIDYVVGMLAELERLDHGSSGADLLIAGDIPIGCGLSSSASLTMATLAALEALGGFELDGPTGAVLGQRAENEFLGLNCGIMDPFVIRMAREGHALLLDCRSMAYEHIPATLEEAVFLIANTGITRGLTGSKYNERVAECGEAAGALREATGKLGTHLRDFTLEDLEAAESTMGALAYHRARHVITENARTLEAADALRAGDAAVLGALMNSSHDSLRDDYEVSCPELDAMAAIGLGHPACFGARMTGGGFGGCTVHLVQREKIDSYTSDLLERYRRITGLEGRVIVSSPAAGAKCVA